MKPTAPEVRTHRILGWLAVVHAAVLLLLLLLFMPDASYDWPPYVWMPRLWVGLATLWFIWPILLAFYPARSWRRVLIPVAIASPFVFVWFRWWSSIWGPWVFGLPDFVKLTPRSVFQYAASFGHGWFDGRESLRSGRLNLEAYGPPLGTFTPSTPKFSEQNRNECGIQIAYVASDVVSPEILAHARGYNLAMMAEIRRRCPDLVKAAEDEDARWERSYAEGEKTGRTEAQADFRSGHFAIVLKDPTRKNDAAFENWLREKYHISVKRVNPFADLKMTNNVFGYATGYNRISDAEIRRRFGKAGLHEIWSEWVKIPQATPTPH